MIEVLCYQIYWPSGAMECTVIFGSNQCIALEVTWQQSTVYIAAVYASTLNRRQLWADLTHVLSSHIFREGNMCADKLANFGHSMVGEVWLPSLPAEVHHELFADRFGFPRIRFP